MSICAPKPFGSKFLKGGYRYYPLWWYGQRSKLHDMSGHGVDLTPSGAYFDGQGYYLDGSDDYLIDDNGQKIFKEGTAGSWHSIYFTEGEVPAAGSICGTGTSISIRLLNAEPKITGKIILYPSGCPNLTDFKCYYNRISFIDVSGLPSLEHFDCAANDLSFLHLSNLPSIKSVFCHMNNISDVDISALTSIQKFYCYDNNISLLDVSGLTGLLTLKCYTNPMNQDMVDTVLCDMDSYGTSGGYLYIYDTAAPSATGVTCKNNLVARGWTVVTD